MKVVSLQSGSNGNCFFVESGDVSLIFDAGISGKQAETRLASHGREIRKAEGLFISHDHSDHTRGMGVFSRKFDLPVYVTRRTLGAVRRQKLGQLNRIRLFARRRFDFLWWGDSSHGADSTRQRRWSGFCRRRP